MSLSGAVAQSIWIRKSVGFAGSTCLWYDYFLTLDQEVDYVWNAPWTVYKVAFLINRYANLFGQTFTLIEETGWIVHNSRDFCKRFNLFSAIFPFLSAESIHIVVILRAWAIWGCKRRIAVILISIYLVYLLLMLGMTIFGTSTSDFQELQYLDVAEICIDGLPPYVWSAFVASFVLDTTVYGLTMWSLRQHLREFRHLYPSSFVRLLVRDATIFYLVSVFYNGFIIITFTLYAYDPKSFLGVSFCIPMLSIAGQHLVLNLRGLRVRSYSPRSISAEVDRRIAALDEAKPEWWQNENDIEAIVGGGRGVPPVDNELREIRGRDRGGETDETGFESVPRDEIGCHHDVGLGGPRRTSAASQMAESTSVMIVEEVRRVPCDGHTPDP